MGDFRTDIEAVTETKPEERKSNADRNVSTRILRIQSAVEANQLQSSSRASVLVSI